MFEIYGKANCPYCDYAKELLEKLGKSYEYHDVVEDAEKRNALFEAVPNVRTVPQIFEGGRYIGGYDDLKNHLGE